MDITCTVDGDLTGAQLTSIVYTVNNGPSRLGIGIGLLIDDNFYSCVVS